MDLEGLVTPLLAQEQVEIVDLSFQKEHGVWTLRFYLDKPGGITLKDCENWSHRIGHLLEERDFISQSYVLEIASPGLDRNLRKLEHFQSFMGERVYVKLYAPLNGQKQYHGILLAADEQAIRIRDDGRDITLPRDQIARAKLDPIIKI
jgi:ribosome maturation factor RimP